MSIAIMSQVWDHARTTEPRELVALLALADWSDEWGGSYPSYATLAKKIRVKKRQTAIDVVSRLVDTGEAYKCNIKGNNKSNLFIVLAGTKDKTAIKKRIVGAITAKGGSVPDDIDKQIEAICESIKKAQSSPRKSTTSSPRKRTSKEKSSSPVESTTASPVDGTALVPASVPNTLYTRQIDTKENGGGNSSIATDNPSPAPSPTAAVTEKDSTEQRPTATEIVAPILKELEAAKRQQAQIYSDNESAILKAFEALNQSIRAGRNPYNPITGTKQLAEKLAARGETEATMKAAWDTCKANGFKPMGAFMKWIQDGYLPPQQEGQETKVFNGTIHVWTDDGGWTDTGRKAV